VTSQPGQTSSNPGTEQYDGWLRWFTQGSVWINWSRDNTKYWQVNGHVPTYVLTGRRWGQVGQHWGVTSTTYDQVSTTIVQKPTLTLKCTPLNSKTTYSGTPYTVGPPAPGYFGATPTGTTVTIYDGNTSPPATVVAANVSLSSLCNTIVRPT
jgi:hypothetical protein